MRPTLLAAALLVPALAFAQPMSALMMDQVEALVTVTKVHGKARTAGVAEPRNFALGAALGGFRVKVDASQDDWKGGFDYGYWGPQIYLMARF